MSLFSSHFLLKRSNLSHHIESPLASWFLLKMSPFSHQFLILQSPFSSCFLLKNVPFLFTCPSSFSPSLCISLYFILMLSFLFTVSPWHVLFLYILSPLSPSVFPYTVPSSPHLPPVSTLSSLSPNTVPSFLERSRSWRTRQWLSGSPWIYNFPLHRTSASELQLSFMRNRATQPSAHTGNNPESRQYMPKKKKSLYALEQIRSLKQRFMKL